MQPNAKPSPLPSTITTVAELEELLSRPSPELIADLSRLDGDIVVVGVGGKVGPTLARMAKRAAPNKRVYGVARFSDSDVRARMESWGIECLPCELTDQRQVQQLPKAANVVFMAGKKFGTTGDEPSTWMMNAVVPAYVAEHYAGSRFVAFSTLCVYPFADTRSAGSAESVAPTPVGEYPNSCVGRERVWQFFSAKHSAPGRLARLNYAIDLRYGVLHDIAQAVRAGRPIDLSTGVANVIWQGDSTNHILRCLAHGTTPASPINIGAPKTAAVRAVAQRFGALFNREPIFSGSEQFQAWHNDCSLAQSLFGDPIVDLDTMIRWNAAWIQAEQPVYQKPTHFGERRGAF
ncbi:MAG: NAD-dependent epimerase/dehydratase family protein [Planctomycetota bacterium]